jgi:signal transduction histidine kinase
MIGSVWSGLATHSVNIMPAKQTSQFQQYGLGIVAALVALATRVLLNPVIGRDRYFFVTFLLAVVFSAWYCGIGPTILCAVLSGLCAWLFVFSPEIIAHHQAVFWGTMLSFGVVSSVVIVVAESQRRVRGSLEARVKERTAELVRVNENLKLLSVRLIELQDEERRRIARELHDSAGQLLAALSMNIGALSRMELTPRAQKLQEDSQSLVQELLRQIRTLSHLLHPPLLDELGLLSAVRWYVDEFTARSGIVVTLKAPQELPRLQQDTELTAFRIVQECLTNVHRHSESARGVVELIQNADSLEVNIRDYGKGIPLLKQGREVQKGVGLRSMEERIAQLGGRLDIESDGEGTEIRAKLPVGYAPQGIKVPDNS